MIVETVDQKTGTILFTEDQESLNIKYLMKKVAELEDRIKYLECLLERTLI